MAEDRLRVLIIDDDDVFRERLMRAFQDRGFETMGAGDASGAVALAQRTTPDWAVVDLRIGTASGLDVVQELLTINPTLQIVILTGYGSIATALESVRRGAINYLTKPTDTDAIIRALRGEPPSGRPLDTPVPSLSQVEWDHIQRVIQDCGGNLSKASRLLGLHRRSLQRKLNKYPGLLH